MQKKMSIFLICFTMLFIIVIKRDVLMNNPWKTMIITSIVITAFVSAILSKFNSLESEINKLSNKINDK
jgi:hypothetical protein